MKIRQLNHVAIQVAEVGRSVGFYRDVLGLEPLERPAFSFPGAWFSLGEGQELHIIGGRERAVDSHNRGNHFALRVDSIEAAAAALRSKGVEMLGPKARPDGAMQVFVRDPDGHYVELCELRPVRSQLSGTAAEGGS